MPAEEFPYDPAYGEPYNTRERYFASRIGDDAGLAARRPAAAGGGADRAAAAPARTSWSTSIEAAGRRWPRTLAPTVRAAHSRTWMPDQTYLQHAQPSTFGHYLLVVRLPGAARRAAAARRLGLDQHEPRRRGLRQRQPAARRPRPGGRAARLRRASSSTPATRCGRPTGSSTCWPRPQPAGRHAEQARRGPGDLGEQRVRLRHDRRRVQPGQRADAAEAQPLRAVDHPRRVRHADRAAQRASSRWSRARRRAATT